MQFVCELKFFSPKIGKIYWKVRIIEILINDSRLYTFCHVHIFFALRNHFIKFEQLSHTYILQNDFNNIPEIMLNLIMFNSKSEKEMCKLTVIRVSIHIHTRKVYGILFRGNVCMR